MKPIDSSDALISSDGHNTSGSLNMTPEPCFDELAKLAAQIYRTSHAFILLADKNQQHCKSKFGPQIQRENCTAALCTLEVRCNDSIACADLLQDNHLNQNPLVANAPHFRFFAAVPILGHNGTILGTLGVLDESPRESGAENLELLRIVTRQIFAQIEVQRQSGIAQRAEKELERRTTESIEREKLLTLVIDLVPHHIFAKDRDGRFLFANQCSAAACGRTPQEMIGRTEYELRPDTAENYLSDDREVIDSGKPKFIAEEAVIYPGNQVHFLQTVKMPFLPPGSKQLAVLGVGIDITERKRTGEELERRTAESLEREKLLTLVIDLVPHHIFAKDRDGRFLFANRRSARACGKTPEEMIGRSEHELRPDSGNADKFLRDDREVLDGGVPKVIPEEHITYADKHVHILHTTKIPFLPPGSKQLAVLGVGIDITERKRAEEELLRFTLMMEHILENVPAFIFWKDLSLNFMGCNKLFAEAAGAKLPADVIGKSDYDMVWKSNAAEYQATDREIIVSGVAKLDYEESQTLTDASVRWVKTSKTPLFRKNGEVFGVLGVYMDITQRKTAEDEIRILNANLERRVEDRTAKLNALNASLTSEIAVRKRAEIDLVNALHAADDANNAKSSFLARMSHEIRTPMNGVIGMNYLLQQTDLNPKQRQYTTKIDFAAQHLLGIINGILDFSKIEAGKTELEIAEFNLEETIRRVLDFTAIQGQSKSLDSKIYFASNTPVKVFGDSLRLGQILTNLVGNAIKFTESGRVEITVAPIELSASSVTLDFKISDTGIGMTKEQLAKIFMPFSQSDTSTTRRFGGTGLGLAIAKSLIHLMGGEISVQSEEGHGSTFRFTVKLGIGQGLKPVQESGEFRSANRSSARMARIESI